MMLFLLLLSIASVSAEPGFLSVGDWGSAALGGYHHRNAMATATAMKAYIAGARAGADVAFVLNTGDNFYYCGIQNTSDPQINEDYTALFGGMGVPWYHSLGNHDYGFSPEAQLMLNATIPEWIMDARYYHRRVVVNLGDGESDDIIVNIIVLDTNPCVRDYRQTDRRKWDPCGTEYPDCSPITEPCRFHENILSQDCQEQLAWARQTLDEITARTGAGTGTGTAREWVFVIGHHKADEIDVADFQTTILDDPRVHLYLNGHNHNLEHYEINGQPKYMTTGAGGMVVIGGRAGAVAKNQTRTTKSIWSKVITGFTSHTFINNGTVLMTEFWDTKSTLLHQFKVDLENQ